jgi:hypothetical protein
MSLYIDTKYLTQISHRFELFKKKSDFLWNVRCPICGDSQQKKTKMRGYFFRKGEDLMYKCHNCQHGAHFGSILKQLDTLLYKEYVLERYAEGSHGKKYGTEKRVKSEVFYKDKLPPLPIVPLWQNLFDCVYSLPYDHEAVEYCEERMIPNEQTKKLYYIENVKDIVQLNKRYKESIITTEPRLVIPFCNEHGRLTGLTMRAMRGETLRYITVKIDESAPTVFGLDTLDKQQPITVVEGPLDSLFLDNAIACAGVAFNQIENFNLPMSKTTIVFDNQPKNKELCKLMYKYIKQGFSICIWPSGIAGKDINEMVLDGMSPVEIQTIINHNTHRGLAAELKFTNWKKC